MMNISIVALFLLPGMVAAPELAMVTMFYLLPFPPLF